MWDVWGHQLLVLFPEYGDLGRGFESFVGLHEALGLRRDLDLLLCLNHVGAQDL